MTKYSITKGFIKAVISFVIFAIPFYIDAFPEITNLTIGALMVMAVNALKVYAKNNSYI